MHQQLLEHLPPPPATVLDVGGGAGHQSFPLARAGYDVTLLDPSPAMLDKARQRLEGLPADAQRRVTFVEADGAHADEAVGGRRFEAVLCHGVLGYLEQQEPLLDQLCQCAAPGVASSRSWRATPTRRRCGRPWNGGGATPWQHSTPRKRSEYWDS
ncbi:class I SAM-dependent methyltransferase [Kribbella sp. NPDC050241]|uniref:class I SAM-dependent methyltransferase n=1 Tax=Kribbella sp. NPDC050241 TaxID=3364115 RepID=UPI0037B54257